MSRDPYDVLGLPRSCTDAEIKRAFRELARQHHPDSNPGDAHAEERFKELSVAYETLGDPERRRRFDTFGDSGARGGPQTGDPFGFGGLFDALFTGDAFGRRGPAGPARGPDAEATVELTIHEAAFGVTAPIAARIPVACERCEGSGCEPGTFPSRCDVCEGAGEVRQVRRSILDESDGPMLLHGLKKMHDQPIQLPRSRADRPDPARLESRYERFLRAS